MSKPAKPSPDSCTRRTHGQNSGGDGDGVVQGGERAVPKTQSPEIETYLCSLMGVYLTPMAFQAQCWAQGHYSKESRHRSPPSQREGTERVAESQSTGGLQAVSRNYNLIWRPLGPLKGFKQGNDMIR